jgi:molybdopterin molybdotransferase
VSREFFTARTVGEALAGFRPSRRTAVETVGLAEALRRVPAADVRAPAAMPGFARSTVDGYAVRAADTYGASESLPSYLDLAGAVRMGRSPTVAVAHGTCVAIPTGAVLPDGADAVVMIEHTAETMPGTIEVTRPVAPGSGLVRADEDAAAGDVLVGAGRPLRAPQLGFLAAAGVTTIAVHARPRVTIVSTGRRGGAAETTTLAAGQVRDATGVGAGRAVPGLPVGCRRCPGIVPDDRDALESTLRSALADNDLGGRSRRVLGRRPRRDRRGDRRGWRDLVPRLAVKPGKPTPAGRVRRACRCSGCPATRCPALVVFRLVGCRSCGGWRAPNDRHRSRPGAPG